VPPAEFPALIVGEVALLLAAVMAVADPLVAAELLLVIPSTDPATLPTRLVTAEMGLEWLRCKRPAEPV
jgi:hypothetical protein